MEEPPVRASEDVPPTGDAPEEEAREQTEWGDGLRKASEAVSLVCAGVLAGGGVGMLAGVALGAINPFVFGIAGLALGAVAPVLLKGARKGTRRPWWRRFFGR